MYCVGQGDNLKVFKWFKLKPGFGPDRFVCAEFARRRRYFFKNLVNFGQASCVGMISGQGGAGFVLGREKSHTGLRGPSTVPSAEGQSHPPGD